MRQCDKCGKVGKTRGIIKFKGNYLCKNCRQRLLTARIQDSACRLGRPLISFEEAQKKIYNVNQYFKNNHCQCTIHVPSILANKKVKLIVVGEQDE